jgi:hypothetical protein
LKQTHLRLARIRCEHQNGGRSRRSPEYRHERTTMKTNSTTSPELDALLRDAAAGDAQAVRGLLERHRARLRRLIASRLDRRLAPRLDPSDVVQETLAEAARRLPDYLRDRPLPFYAWLFRLAVDRLVRTHQDHVASTVRGVGQEERLDGGKSVSLRFRRFTKSWSQAWEAQLS